MWSRAMYRLTKMKQVITRPLRAKLKVRYVSQRTCSSELFFHDPRNVVSATEVRFSYENNRTTLKPVLTATPIQRQHIFVRNGRCAVILTSHQWPPPHNSHLTLLLGWSLITFKPFLTGEALVF